MTKPRKVAVALGALVALLLALLIAVPLLFRDRIEQGVKAHLNRTVAARVDWKGLGLTFFRNFPHLTLRMDEVSVAGVDRFEGDTLASVGRLRVVLGLGSVLRAVAGGDRLVVRSVRLDRPAVHLRVLEDGTANWDITRETPEQPDQPDQPDQDGGALEVALRRVTIRDAILTLENREAGLDLALHGFDQSLAGDFSRERFTLRTRAEAEEASLRFAGVPYLTGVRLVVRADIDANRAAGEYSFRDNQVQLNDLALRFTGTAATTDDGVALNLEFGAARTAFRHLLSLIPAIYARDFAALESSGTMSVSGRVSGTYGEHRFPALALRATVDQGRFRYPDRPIVARDISLDLAVDNPGGDLDSTVVTLNRLHMLLGDDPIEASFTVRTPVSDPDLALRLAGRADLGHLARTLTLDRVERLTGRLVADLALRTRMSNLDAKQYDRITARGSAEARDVGFKLVASPHALSIEEARVEFSPQAAELTAFRGRIGESDLDLTGRLDNLLAYLVRDSPLQARATLRSGRFDLNAWRSDEEELEIIPVPAKVDLTMQATIGKLPYGKLELQNARGTVRVRDQRLTLEEFAAGFLGGEIVVTGFYETTDPTRPTFDAMLRMTNLDIPSAFEALATVQVLAPVARYALGTFSADLGIQGALGPDMIPLFEVLKGRGSLQTSRLSLTGFPPTDRIAEVLHLSKLKNPTLDPLWATLEIGSGRLHLLPFELRLAGFSMTVEGSHGIDRTLDYGLRLRAPPGLFGAETNQVISGWLAQAGRAGLDLGSADVVELGLRLTGTLTDPVVRPDVDPLIASLEQAARRTAGQAVEALEQRGEQAVDAARRQAQAEADRILREAEQRATAVRQEAERLAAKIREEGYAQADSLVARASGPLALVAARLAADRLRKETDTRSEQIVRTAEQRAQEILEEARKRANALREPDRPDQPPEVDRAWQLRRM